MVKQIMKWKLIYSLLGYVETPTNISAHADVMFSNKTKEEIYGIRINHP